MAEDIEAELEFQLASQREALLGIDEAINLGGDCAAEGHAELQQMRTELQAAVSELEAALLEIKRERILQQLAAHDLPGPSTVQTTDASLPPNPPAQVVLGPGPSHHPPAIIPNPAAGSPCHFRYMDGRWYAGRVHGPGRQAGTLSVLFAIPTRPFMLDPVDVMEALVRHCSADTPAVPAAGTVPGSKSAGPSHSGARVQQQQQQHHLPQPSSASNAAQGEFAVGRKALAQLPGFRLYVPVEVVALDATRATATVLPLLPPPQGYAGRSGGGEVVVPLALMTRHAHVVPPPAAGRVGDESESDGEGGGGGCSSSSSSVSALLRPGIGSEESSEGDWEEDGEGDDDIGDKEDMDLYGSDGDNPDDGEGSGGGGGEGDGKRRGEVPLSTRGVNDGSPEETDEMGGALDVFKHARLAAAAGVLDDSALLADWEAHGRGVASRLLVRMGYVRGKGLGSKGQGTMAAPEVLLLPERKGLGAADKDRLRKVGGGGSSKLQGGAAKRRSKRGGSRQKRKRAIVAAQEARREVREAEEGVPGGGGLFDFINSSLGDSSAAARIRKAQVSVAGVAAAGTSTATAAAASQQTAGAAAIAGAVAAASGGPPRRPPDRQGLMNHHDNVATIQTKLCRLQEMLGRHKDNRGLRTQIEAQIRAVQGELAAAQSAAARASKAIHDKDAQKKWLKF